MSPKRKQPARPRQCKPLSAISALALLLAACNIGQQTTGVPPGFIGGVVADEPRAALIGRDVLSAGGSAADAAVAAAFAMAVTLPSRAGLGGGGICLVYDPRLNRVEALDFVARAPASGGAAAVPAVARGLFSLYGRQGKLRWEQLVAPAEGLARFGAPVSRALATDLETAAHALAESATRRIFQRPDGTSLAEGDTLVQQDLSGVLAAIRGRGANDLYIGQTAAQFVAGVTATRVGIAADDMRAVAAVPRPSVLVRPTGDIAVHFAPPPSVVGTSQAQLFAVLAPRWRRTSAEERPHLLAEAAQRAGQDRARWLTADMSIGAQAGELVGAQRVGELMASYRAGARTAVAAEAPPPFDPATAGVAAVDREGGGVACSFTMNALFGTGRVVPGTGIVLAAAPDGAARGPQMLSPMLAAMSRGGRIVFASTSSGGWPGAGAQVQVALRTVVEERQLEEAMDFARIYNPGSGPVQVEEAIQGPLPGLAARGYSPTTVTNLGQVNAIYCPDGLFENAEACQFRADRRGAGFAAGR